LARWNFHFAHEQRKFLQRAGQNEFGAQGRNIPAPTAKRPEKLPAANIKVGGRLVLELEAWNFSGRLAVGAWNFLRHCKPFAQLKWTPHAKWNKSPARRSYLWTNCLSKTS
jgi:hypothetical protein